MTTGRINQVTIQPHAPKRASNLAFDCQAAKVRSAFHYFWSSRYYFDALAASRTGLSHNVTRTLSLNGLKHLVPRSHAFQSLSPRLSFRRRGSRISMKTAFGRRSQSRGHQTAADLQIVNWFAGLAIGK